MKDCVGMLLAGGEGKRLGTLTRTTAKPAVYFGGKYRIIDFSLSNCANSNLHTVGVLTQYSPLELNEHIGNGSHWGFHREMGRVTVLSPYTAQHGQNWYLGTADSIYKNIHFIDQYDPKYVLIMSGDHIYEMDYRALLNEHKQAEADVTISVIEVPWDEASRFGILHADDSYRITKFVEKPAKPQSNLASMGIYLFNWQVLRKQLIADANDSSSSHDFGNDIIPKMLQENLHLQAYPYKGYWKDVGTIDSYWEANMDLVDMEWNQTLHERIAAIQTKASNSPPLFVGEEARIESALVNSGCHVYGEVEQSILFRDVLVRENSVIVQSIVHPEVTIGKDCYLDRVIVMEGTIIPDGTTIVSEATETPFVVNNENIAQFSRDIERLKEVGQ